MSTITFDNSYSRLPERFFTQQTPVPVQAPTPIRSNAALARELGMDADWLASPEGVQTVAGNVIPDGANPIATVYAGHQFGGYNPQLGDGRAVMLGELITPDGKRVDLQLKGSGPTPYSRGGDGRSPLGPVLREYILSETMHRLGIPTTRALAAVATGELVQRDSYQPGAVLARVASSHIRIGTVQFFAAKQDIQALQLLSQHVIERHFPEAASSGNPVLAMLQGIISRQAQLVAGWQLLGFIHGVMNTDNVLLCGETIDYGPCAFMDAFKADQVYSSIDQGSRYAYRNQPAIAHWNLSCLAQALLPLLDEDQDKAIALAQDAIDSFPTQFLDAHTRGMANKLGLAEISEQDTAMVEDLMELMEQQKLDFTLTFRRLADLADESAASGGGVGELFQFPPAMDMWLARWRKRIAKESIDGGTRQAQMYRVNPVFIPRNHLVEAAIEAASQHNDLSVFDQLLQVLEEPHIYRPEFARFATGPQSHEVVQQTFCGT